MVWLVVSTAGLSFACGAGSLASTLGPLLLTAASFRMCQKGTAAEVELSTTCGKRGLGRVYACEGDSRHRVGARVWYAGGRAAFALSTMEEICHNSVRENHAEAFDMLFLLLVLGLGSGFRQNQRIG